MRALLDYNDFYAFACADCGCHDNRFDKLWWNEQWLGAPTSAALDNGAAASYVENSNAVDAHKLSGQLMLIVGQLDANVDPQATMLVVSQLVKHGKDFELLVLPDHGHGCAETEYGNLRRLRFLYDCLRR